ncbi:MAG: type II secretion system protein [Pirellulaceae bacterium]
MRITKRQHGFTVTEVIVAFALVGVLLAAISSFGALQSVRGKLSEQRLVASQELANRGAEIAATQYEALTEDWAETLRIHPSHAALLERFHWEITIQEIDQPAAGKRIDWALVPDSPHLPTYRLSTWKFARDSATREAETTAASAAEVGRSKAVAEEDQP